MAEGPGKPDDAGVVSVPSDRERGVLPALSRAARQVMSIGIAVFLAVFSGVFAYAFSQPDEFTSTAYLSFDPRASRQLSADSIQVFATKYQAFLVAPATLTRISAETGVDRQVLKNSVRAEIPPATVNMSIAVTFDDAATAARLANAFAAAAVQQSVNDENLRAEVLSPGIVPVEPSGPPRRLLVLGGGVLGLGAAVLVVMVLDRLSGRRVPTGPGRERVAEDTR